MQTRIDILASEFSFLRSTWALSQVESRNFERSLRALPGHVSLRRLTRTRRVEPPLTLGQLDPDETANNLLVRDDFEDEVIPYEPPGVRLARRRRYLDSIADRRRAAAASTTATAGNPAGNVPTTAPTTTTTTTAAPTTYASAPGMPVLVALGAGNYPLATVVAEARERQRQMAQRLEEYRQQQRQPAMMQSRALEIAASQAVGSQATASQPTGSQVTVPQASPDSERDKQKVLLSKMMEEFTVRGMR
ncbi:hypothetical protein DFH27DRAFT_560199 [Peziza echinospora]|nr:hypothetical protein DFH27DRAFT_560199 [Peziza echinospora]